MKIQILDRTKKKKLLSELGEFGLEKIPELLIRSGSERIRAYSGDLSTEEIMGLWRILPIEAIGLYVAKEKIDKNGVREVRLSVDALHLWKNQIKDKIIILSEEEEKEWFKSNKVDLEKPTKFKGFVVIKSADEKDLIGTAKVSDEGKKLLGFLPKERRRKEGVIS